MQFTGICLITNNVPILADFYAKVLGINVEGDAMHCELHTEGASIAIFSVEGMAPQSMQGAGHGNFTIGFEVKDVDAEYARLKSLVNEFVLLPTTHPWGARSVWFRDPDGNSIDFYENIPDDAL